MKQKHIYLLFIVLIAISVIVYLSYGIESSGSAYFAGNAFELSNFTVIFVAVFVVLLIAIILSLKLFRQVGHIQHSDPIQGNISMSYMIESLEKKKKKKEIRADLKDMGYAPKQIEEFLKSYEKHIERVRKAS